MTDKNVVNLVVWMLGTIALAALAGVVLLAFYGKNDSALSILGTIASGASGAVGGLLASTRSAPPQGEEAAKVKVVNEPKEAIPVEEGEA